MDDAEIIDNYTERQRARGLSPDTLRCYRDVFRQFAVWLGEHDLSLLTATEAQITSWACAEGRSNTTRLIYIKRLDLLFRFIQEREWRPDNPAKLIPRPKVARAVPRPLPTAGLLRALATADPRVGLMLALAAYAGLRRAEIAGLNRLDVLDDHEPPLLLVHGKGGKERLVPIGPVVAAAFARYGLPESGHVFPGQGGEHIRRYTVGQLVSGHLRASGVDATTHQGRHWFATSLYQGSGDLRLTQEMLGHASPATTAIYAAWSPNRAARAIDALPTG